MSTSPKQLAQRRLMGTQQFKDTQARKDRRRPESIAPRKMPPVHTGHAAIGTDADVRAYMLRMGYAVIQKPGEP